MKITQDEIDLFRTLIIDLYDHLFTKNIPDKAPYFGYLEIDKPFALDEHGYWSAYIGIIQKAFQLPSVDNTWSEEGLQGIVHDLLLDLAKKKENNQSDLDFNKIASEWLSKLDITFDQNTCYSIVAGLSVEHELEIGDVSFLPLDFDQPSLNDEFLKLRNELHPYRNCFACSNVTADIRRASEIHRQRTQISLNILRYIGSLIWHREPTHHIYLKSLDPKRISESLVVSSKGNISCIGASEFQPLPFRLDSETIPYANSYGLSEIQNILHEKTLSEIKQSLLTGIQWFGEATQELFPLVAFVKYYISIETAIKKESESAKSVLPKRMSVLIDPWGKKKNADLIKDIRGFVDERNSVFHSGIPVKYTAEGLAWDARILARQTLFQLYLRIRDNHIQTKDDLISWVNSQYSEYLAT
jgi:hypothetical protein